MKSKQFARTARPTTASIEDLLITQHDQKAHLELSRIRKDVYTFGDPYEGILDCFCNK